MNKVLIITGRYLPGYKDGGPVRSILNLTEWFGDDYDIRIMCLDRDHGDADRYPGIEVDTYTTMGKAKVWYTEKYNAKNIAKASDEADVVYCCGPYSDYAIISMRLKKNGRMKAPLVIASMGSFSPEAYAIKGKKKQWFVKIMKLLKMFDAVTWSVTSEREESELKAVIGGEAKCVIASDLARKTEMTHIAKKQKNSLKMLFLSRISRKKNLVVIPDILTKVNEKYNITIDIYGIAEDESYLAECMSKFENLSDNICWKYRGEIDSEGVPAIFAEYDAFLFPTLGENYGHVIAESLAAGCVPVISDQTPWMDLNENNAGYVCDLHDLFSFADAINELAESNDELYSEKIKACMDYVLKKNTDAVQNSGYRKIFDLNY